MDLFPQNLASLSRLSLQEVQTFLFVTIFARNTKGKLFQAPHSTQDLKQNLTSVLNITQRVFGNGCKRAKT